MKFQKNKVDLMIGDLKVNVKKVNFLAQPV